MKQCTVCGMTHSDDKVFCANCGNQLVNVQDSYMNMGMPNQNMSMGMQGMPNQNMSMGMQGMPNQNMGMGMQGMPNQNMGMGMQNMQLATPPAKNSSAPVKKKSSKKWIIVVVAVLLVAAIAGVVAIFVIKGSKPKADFYVDNLPEELIVYEFDGEEYSSEVVDVKIIKEEKEDGVVETECEITLDDDLMTRTLYYTLTCEKEDGEWKIVEYSENEDVFITAKENLAELIVSDYELENLSDLELESENEDSEFSFSYNVDDSYDALTLSGTISFDVDIMTYDTDEIAYYCETEMNESELVADWYISGSYYDDTSSEDVILGTKIEQDDNYADMEFYTQEYGVDEGSAYIDDYSIFDEYGKIQCIIECYGYEATYYVYFDKDGIVSATAEGFDGTLIDEGMVAGEYTVEPVTDESESDDQPISQPNENGIVENIPEIYVPSADGVCIQVYSWNSELGQRIDTHFRTRYPELSDLVIYNNLDLSGVSDEYSAKIDAAIDAGGDMVPSIIVADIDVARSFMMKDYVVPVSDIGITEAMYANAYDYTVEYATLDGQLMALTWQAMPGVVAYRTDIAEEVLGFSDPESVQAAIGTWDDFFAVAEMMKSAGMYMVSGPDDIKYAVRGQKMSPWVVDGALNIDPSVNAYLEYSKKLYDNGYTKNTCMWSSDWNANMADDVFCYFGCTWFIPWTLSIEDTDAMGKYNVVSGPCAYNWGGSYLMVTDACPNKELAALVLYTLCCDAEAMYDIFDIDFDFCNNKLAVYELIADGKGCLDKLGGQNPLPVYDESARAMRMDMATPYDLEFNSYLDVAADGYNMGDFSTIDDAIAYIREQVAANHSEIAAY